MGEVGREIRRLREARGWGQTKLAAAADMAVSGVSQIENGHRNPNSATLIKLARALEVEVADLFPKAQAALPLEGASEELDIPLAEWFEEICGHAYLAGSSAEIVEFMRSGDRAERLALMKEELHAFAEERQRRGLNPFQELRIGGVDYVELMKRYLIALFTDATFEDPAALTEEVAEVAELAGAAR